MPASQPKQPVGATHEQLISTSSRPTLDPTVGINPSSDSQNKAKEFAPKTASQSRQDAEDGKGTEEAEKHMRTQDIKDADKGSEDRENHGARGLVGKGHN